MGAVTKNALLLFFWRRVCDGHDVRLQGLLLVLMLMLLLLLQMLLLLLVLLLHLLLSLLDAQLFQLSSRELLLMTLLLLTLLMLGLRLGCKFHLCVRGV